MKPFRTLRSALLAPALWLAVTLPALAAPVSLSDISAYLNGIRTAETDFTQLNADGSTASGKLMIKRPGRMRFEYAAPDKTLVLAGAGQVAIYDSKSNQPPEQYPLRRTPLNLILANKVDLGRAKMVVDHGETQGLTTVTAQDPDHPEYGTITLFFAPAPLRLAQWVVTDESGQQTLVRLGDFRTDVSYPPSMFSISTETERRGIR